MYSLVVRILVSFLLFRASTISGHPPRPVSTQNVALPVSTQNVAVPVSTQNVAVPVSTQNVAVPVSTQNVAVPVSTQNVAVPVSIISSTFTHNNNTIDKILGELLKDNCIFNITLANDTLNQKIIMKVTAVNKEMADRVTFRESVRLFELRKRRRISAEILFLFCGIFTLEIVHMVFLELFIRLTKTRFRGHKRFKFYTNMTMALTFLISSINLMLIILFYRCIELYVQD